ncbi:MAG TPA: hypothetical protein VFZ26_16310 [Gemmatimonadales bacterium]
MRYFPLLAPVALLACHDASDPDKQRVVGLIDPGRSTPPVLVAPAEVAVHERFIVTVHTVGSSDCTQPDGASVVVEGDLVRIVPYDIVPMPGHTDVCREDYAPHAHPLPLTLSRAGTARLRVVGRRPAGRDGVPDSVEVGVTVLP